MKTIKTLVFSPEEWLEFMNKITTSDDLTRKLSTPEEFTKFQQETPIELQRIPYIEDKDSITYLQCAIPGRPKNTLSTETIEELLYGQMIKIKESK